MIRKTITLAAVLAALTLPCMAARAVEPAELHFEQNKNGKYIYCNNHERIRSTDLADNTNQYAKFIMNNEGLTKDQYAVFLSFMNQTNLNAKNEAISDTGFDVEVDVLFRAKEDTQITIQRMGFEIPQHHHIFFEKNQFTTEDEWGCFDCWADYLGYPIKQIDSGNVYDADVFPETTFTVKAGEEVWLSKYIPDYCEVPFARSVNLMADFSIDSGVCDVNVAAFRATGKPGDRSNFNKNAEFGHFVRDRQYKGISDGLNEVTAKVEYTIDDSTPAGKLPVTVFNHYYPEGSTITDWFTHLNSRNDPWSYEYCADSDMIVLDYYDPNKLSYYGSAVPESEKDPYYHFDIYHTDLTDYKPEYGKSSTFVPNAELTEDTPRDYSCNLANYGVIYNYDLTIRNDGNIRRYFLYKLDTTSNNLVYVKDKDGNVVDNRILSKGRPSVHELDDMACITVPARSVAEYTISVVLTPNYPGGMKNCFYLSNYPSMIETYTTGRGGIEKDKYFTGREYYKWDGGTLNISSDRENWQTVQLTQSVIDDMKSSYSEYELKWTGNGYVIRPRLYDAGWYEHVNSYYRNVYYLDENFNLKQKRTLGSYPQGLMAFKDKFFVQCAGTTYISKDFIKWDVTYHDLPCWNYGYVAAVNDQGKIKLTGDGESFAEVEYKDFKPDYIDALGRYYYCADGRTLYLSENGVYWRSVTFGEKIKSVDILNGEVVANGKEARQLPLFNENCLLKLNGRYYETETEGVLIDGVPYVPLRETAELMGYAVDWQDGVITLTDKKGRCEINAAEVVIRDDTSYASMQTLTERLHLNAVYDADARTVAIEY